MIRDLDPMGNDLRRERRARVLPRDAACVMCGETNPEILMQAEAPSVLELHHLAGKANDPDLLVVLCLNHHRVQTARQPGYGVELSRDPQRTSIEKLVSMLRSLGLFLVELGKAMVAKADDLAAHVAGLDAHYPAWRAMPSAQT